MVNNRTAVRVKLCEDNACPLLNGTPFSACIRVPLNEVRSANFAADENVPIASQNAPNLMFGFFLTFFVFPHACGVCVCV